MSQSSIEWYAKETAKITLAALRGGMTTTEYRVLQDAALRKAKEMHKEEIIEAWNNGAIDATYGNKFSSPEQYYNETFNK